MHQLRVLDIIQQPGDNITFKLVPVQPNFPAYEAGQFLSLIFHFGEREILEIGTALLHKQEN